MGRLKLPVITSRRRRSRKRLSSRQLRRPQCEKTTSGSLSASIGQSFTLGIAVLHFLCGYRAG
jgi:hypothetical protein